MAPAIGSAVLYEGLLVQLSGWFQLHFNRSKSIIHLWPFVAFCGWRCCYVKHPWTSEKDTLDNMFAKLGLHVFVGIMYGMLKLVPWFVVTSERGFVLSFYLASWYRPGCSLTNNYCFSLLQAWLRSINYRLSSGAKSWPKLCNPRAPHYCFLS